MLGKYGQMTVGFHARTPPRTLRPTQGKGVRHVCNDSAIPRNVVALVAAKRRHRHDLRLRGPHPDVAHGLPERATDPGEGGRAGRRGRVHRRGRRRRPGGLPQVRPDGQRHDLGPRRLSRSGFLCADAARPRRVPRRTDRANAVSDGLRQPPRRPRRRPWTAAVASAFKTNRYDAATRHADAAGRQQGGIRRAGRVLDELLRRPGEERRTLERRRHRSGRAAQAHRVLRLDGLGLGRPTARQLRTRTPTTSRTTRWSAITTPVARCCGAPSAWCFCSVASRSCCSPSASSTTSAGTAARRRPQPGRRAFVRRRSRRPRPRRSSSWWSPACSSSRRC